MGSASKLNSGSPGGYRRLIFWGRTGVVLHQPLSLTFFRKKRKKAQNMNGIPVSPGRKMENAPTWRPGSPFFGTRFSPYFRPFSSHFNPTTNYPTPTLYSRYIATLQGPGYNLSSSNSIIRLVLSHSHTTSPNPFYFLLITTLCTDSLLIDMMKGW